MESNETVMYTSAEEDRLGASGEQQVDVMDVMDVVDVMNVMEVMDVMDGGGVRPALLSRDTASSLEATTYDGGGGLVGGQYIGGGVIGGQYIWPPVTAQYCLCTSGIGNREG